MHGGAGIFARGVEIHEPGGTGEFPDDTDRHVGLPVPEAWLAGPSVEFLLAAESEAAHPGPALSDRFSDWMRFRRLTQTVLPVGGAS